MLVVPEGLEPSTTRLSTVRVCQLRHDSNELNWYRRRDSNPHCLVPKTSASSRLGYAGKSKEEGGGMRDESAKLTAPFHPSSLIPHPCLLVDLARFERATSTFAESRSHSAELQVRIGTGILGEESATRLSWHRTYPLQGLRFGLRQWRRWSDSNAHRISPGTLAGCCHAS